MVMGGNNGCRCVATAGGDGASGWFCGRQHQMVITMLGGSSRCWVAAAGGGDDDSNR